MILAPPAVARREEAKSPLKLTDEDSAIALCFVDAYDGPASVALNPVDAAVPQSDPAKAAIAVEWNG